MLRYTYIASLVTCVPDGSDWSIWHLQPFDLQAYCSQYPLKAVQRSYDCWFNGESFSESSVVYPVFPIHCRMRNTRSCFRVTSFGLSWQVIPKLRSSGFLLRFKSLSLFQRFGRPRCILSNYNVKMKEKNQCIRGKNRSTERSRGNKAVLEKVATTRTEDGHK